MAITIDGLYFCGGSMIDSTHVLTAAHCADGARSFEVTFGAHNINQNEPSQISEASTDYTIHPNWNPNTLSGDMAIIRLKNAVPLTRKYIFKYVIACTHLVCDCLYTSIR